MGPVTFHSRAKFRRLLASSLWSDRHRFRKDTIAFRRIIEYYGAFSWIAEISLRGFEEDKSKETAEAAVRSAVDCLHLLLGYQNTHRLRVGGSTQSWEKRAGIRKVEGNLTWEVSSHSTTDAGSEEEWPRIFADAGYERALGLCGTALRSIVEPEIERPLSHRFLDAAQWFGEAVRETSKAAKVVKYVTALERILMTDEKADITTTVSSRAAAFCYAIPSKSSLNAWKSEAQRAYAIRSKLVHGSMSPEADEVHEGIRLAAKVSDASIHSVLAALGEEGLLAEKVSAKRLAKWFDGACKSAVEQAIAD